MFSEDRYSLAPTPPAGGESPVLVQNRRMAPPIAVEGSTTIVSVAGVVKGNIRRKRKDDIFRRILSLKLEGKEI